MADLEALDRAVHRLNDSISAIYVNLYAREKVRQSQRGPQRLLFPTGTYAARLWQPDEDVHLVCMSNDRPSVLWEIVGDALGFEKLAIPPDSTILSRSPGNSTNTRVYLHHCPTPESFDISTIDGYGVPLYIFSVPRSLRVQKENEMSSFLDPASRAEEKAEYGRNMHETSAVGRHLRMIYDAEVLTSSREGGMTGNERKWANFKSTFRHVRTWLQTNGLIESRPCDLGFPNAETALWMTYRALEGSDLESEADAMRVFLDYWSEPSEHIMSPSSRDFGQQIVTAATSAIMRSIVSTPPSDILQHSKSPESAFREFVSDHHLVKIETECWGTAAQASATNGQSLAQTLRAVQAMLLSDAPAPIVRLWHAPLVPVDPIRSRDSSENSLVFAIGIQLYKGMHRIEKIVDSVNRNPGRDSQEGGCIHLSSTFDDISAWTVRTAVEDAAESRSAANEQPKKHAKLLHAHRVLKRLQWHPEHRGLHYEVGYKDRFIEDLQWMSVEQWGEKPIEHEEFIPESRIWKFRRARDCVIVWDREARIDLT